WPSRTALSGGCDGMSNAPSLMKRLPPWPRSTGHVGSPIQAKSVEPTCQANEQFSESMPGSLRRLCRRPIGSPAARFKTLVARMLSERHDNVGAETQRLGTGVDERLRKFQPLLGRATTPDVAGDAGCRLGVAGATVPHASFAQLAKRHPHHVGCRLHNAGELSAQSPGQIALDLDRIMLRNVELKVRHCLVPFCVQG